jgi:hypothetical protein
MGPFCPASEKGAIWSGSAKKVETVAKLVATVCRDGVLAAGTGGHGAT